MYSENKRKTVILDSYSYYFIAKQIKKNKISSIFCNFNYLVKT